MRKREDLNGVKPEFDWTGLSWEDGREANRLQPALRRAYLLLEQPEVLLNRELYEEALAELDGVTDKMLVYMSRVVTHVPVEWLVKNAPEGLDWSDVNAFRYLQAHRFAALQAAMFEAAQPENASGG